MARTYQRFVALGDSQTEGLDDRDPDGGLRGWADRFAAMLSSTTSPGLTYANLALRGRRARHVLEVQLPAALALEPDLAAVVVGMNDLLRHDYDLDETVDQVEQTFAALRAAGADVVSMTFPDVAQMLPVMGWLRPREEELNARLVQAAARHDVPMLDLFGTRLAADPRMWAPDRIHGSSEGHARIAAGMAELMGLPGADHSWAETDFEALAPVTVVRREAAWLAGFVGPFLYRQWRGTGPGSTSVPKRPGLLPVLAQNDEGVPTGATTRGCAPRNPVRLRQLRSWLRRAP
jgi:lysophospholipase L1-like esterase